MSDKKPTPKPTPPSSRIVKHSSDKPSPNQKATIPKPSSGKK